MSQPLIDLLQGLPLAVVFGILYLLYIRPQRRLVRAYNKMLGDLRPGDQVVTEGGLYARIAQLLSENDLILEFSPTVQVKARRRAILEVVAKAPIDQPPNSVEAVSGTQV
jgi:preprotein translocase subunit YajC